MVQSFLIGQFGSAITPWMFTGSGLRPNIVSFRRYCSCELFATVWAYGEISVKRLAQFNINTL